MFLDSIDKLYNNVQKATKQFLSIDCNELQNSITAMRNFYINEFDIDTDDYNKVPDAYKEVYVKYKTLKYFNNIYNKLVELRQEANNGPF